MIRHFEISINQHGLEYDADYGCEHRSGWTLWINGSCVKQLVPFWKLFTR